MSNAFMTVQSLYAEDGDVTEIAVHLPADADMETLSSVVRMLFRAGQAALPTYTFRNGDPGETTVMPTTDLDATRVFRVGEGWTSTNSHNVVGQ